MKCPYCEYVDGWSGVEVGTIEGNAGAFFKLPVKMERPYCEYVDGWPGVEVGTIEGNASAFFKLPVKMEREEMYHNKRKDLYACPQCRKTFIEV